MRARGRARCGTGAVNLLVEGLSLSNALPEINSIDLQYTDQYRVTEAVSGLVTNRRRSSGWLSVYGNILEGNKQNK